MTEFCALPTDMITQVMRHLPLQDRVAVVQAHVGDVARLSAMRASLADCWSEEDYFLASRPAHLRVLHRPGPPPTTPAGWRALCEEGAEALKQPHTGRAAVEANPRGVLAALARRPPPFVDEENAELQLGELALRAAGRGAEAKVLKRRTEDPLATAVGTCNRGAVEQLLAGGAPVKVRLLRLVIYPGRRDIIALLLRAVADRQATYGSRTQCDAVQMALWTSDAPCLRRLLAQMRGPVLRRSPPWSSLANPECKDIFMRDLLQRRDPELLTLYGKQFLSSPHVHVNAFLAGIQILHAAHVRHALDSVDGPFGQTLGAALMAHPSWEDCAARRGDVVARLAVSNHDPSLFWAKRFAAHFKCRGWAIDLDSGPAGYDEMYGWAEPARVLRECLGEPSYGTEAFRQERAAFIRTLLHEHGRPAFDAGCDGT